MGWTVVSSLVSVDGYTAGPGEDVMAMPLDQAFGIHNVESMAQASSLLFGATTVRGMLTCPNSWTIRTRATSPGATRTASPSPSSRTPSPRADRARRRQTTIVPRAEARDAVAGLRKRNCGTLVFGSRTLWTHLLAHGLVDVLYLMIGPKIVAGDHRTFDGVPETNLHLLDARLEDSEIVLLTYAVAARS